MAIQYQPRSRKNVKPPAEQLVYVTLTLTKPFNSVLGEIASEATQAAGIQIGKGKVLEQLALNHPEWRRRLKEHMKTLSSAQTPA